MSISIWMVLLQVYFNDHLNHSNLIRNEQVMAFSCQLVGFYDVTEEQFAIIIFQCLFSIFETGTEVLCAPIKLRL